MELGLLLEGFQMSVVSRIADRELAEHTDAQKEFDAVCDKAVEFAAEDLCEIKLAVLRHVERLAKSIRDELTEADLARSVLPSAAEFVAEQFSIDSAVVDRITDRVAFHVGAYDERSAYGARASVAEFLKVSAPFFAG